MVKGVNMVLTEKLILDIDSQLNRVEDVFKRHIPILEDWRFVRTERYPVIKRCMYDTLSVVPYLPFLCVECVDLLLNHFVYRYKNNIEDYLVNKLTNSGINFALGYDRNVDEIIRDYIPTVSEQEIEYINNIVYSIYKHIRPYIDAHPADIIKFEYDTQFFIMVNDGNIGNYRYREAIDLIR